MSTYITFIQNIRTKYPNTQIFVMRTFSGDKAAPTLAAVNAVRADGNLNIHFINTTGWLSASDFGADGFHPTDAGQVKVAGLLTPILAPYVGATGTITADDSVQGSELDEFNYVGSGWGHGTSDDGNKIKFYGVVGPQHGIGAFSLDGGAETQIDFYSATNAGDTLLYSSPVLVAGQHTLKVRVTGNKSSHATWNGINPDRVVLKVN